MILLKTTYEDISNQGVITIMNKQYIAPLLLSLGLGLPHCANAALSNSDIDKLAHEFMQKNQVDGLAIAVIKNNQTRIFNYGFADAKKNIPVSKDTIFTIASFTKTFTGTLGAIAAVENKLDLDAPFVQYFPDLKNDNLNQITSRQLLSHVSSLPFDFDPHPSSYAELVKSYNKLKIDAPVASKYHYSNVSIGTMGYVLQNVYAKPYESVLNEKILKPLKMTSTYLNLPQDKEKLLAVGHDKENNVVPFSRKEEPWFAAASLKSTVTDMAKYVQAHMDYEALHNKTLKSAIPLAHENTYCFADKISCEQLAWQAHDIAQLDKAMGDTYFVNYAKNGDPTFEPKQIVEHADFANKKIIIDKTGGGYGMSSYMAYLPAEKAGVVIMLNKSNNTEKVQLGRDILFG